MTAMTHDSPPQDSRPGVVRPGRGRGPARPRELRLGALLLLLLVLACAVGPMFAPYGPKDVDVVNLLQGPSSAHWLGTDQLGRDVLSRLLYGGRIDIALAFAVLVVPFVTGVLVGLVAGLKGGWVDAVAMRTADAIQAFPVYVLVLAIVFSLGPGVSSIFIAFAVINWVPYARLVRGDVQVVKGLDYVLAARAASLSRRRVALRHVLPNVLRQPAVYAMSDVVMNMLAIVTLGYLGVGVQPPTPDWGAMISDGQAFIATNPSLSVFPGICIVLTGLSVALIGDGLLAKDDDR